MIARGPIIGVGSSAVEHHQVGLAEALGVGDQIDCHDRYVDEAYYVGFTVGDQEIGLDPNAPTAGPIGYWEVDDIKGSLQLLLAAGAQAQQDVKDVGGGKLIASVRDPDGNTIGLIQSP